MSEKTKYMFCSSAEVLSGKIFSLGVVKRVELGKVPFFVGLKEVKNRNMLSQVDMIDSFFLWNPDAEKLAANGKLMFCRVMIVSTQLWT